METCTTRHVGGPTVDNCALSKVACCLHGIYSCCKSMQAHPPASPARLPTRYTSSMNLGLKPSTLVCVAHCAQLPTVVSGSCLIHVPCSLGGSCSGAAPTACFALTLNYQPGHSQANRASLTSST